jgi:Tfp pilus assembly protein PilE
MKNNEKGITLVALVITIIVLLILVSVSISAGKSSIKEASDDTQFTELKEVQTAIAEKKMKEDLLSSGDFNLPGTKATQEQLESIVNELNANAELTGDFYILDTEDLKELGITNTTDEFIVNYETYEVINATQINSSKGNALYLSGIE